MGNLITLEDIARRIYFIRGIKVMLDRDLAELYEVETRVLNQAVRRQMKRFPEDFMFQLTSSWGGIRKMPLAFTEQGVAMLSGILNSDKAIEVNIQIMRAFIKLRHMILEHDELKRELDELRKEMNLRFQIVFTVLDKLVTEDEETKRKIGFIEPKGIIEK